MTVYTVTTSNWNAPAFWSAISEAAAGHTLDFSALGPSYSVDLDEATGRLIVSDGVTPFTIGEPGDGGADATLGGATQFSFFTTKLGGDGDDTLDGGAGSDTLIGGTGDDLISGGDGADVLKSGQGQDTLDGGAGDDTLMNAAGDDSLIGGAGADLIVATQGNDTLLGGVGNDTLMGGTGGDSLDGGADNDLLLGDLAGVDFNATGTKGVGLAANITDFPATQLTYEITFASSTTTGNAPFVSYATPGGSNSFLVIEVTGQLQIVINDSFEVNTGVPTAGLFDGDIHTLAVKWDSATGAVEIYVDGDSVYTGTLAAGQSIAAGGTLALGQEQDSVGGGFATTQIFQGTIYGARLYDDVRTPAEILDSTHGPVADVSDGNLVANWVADPDSATLTDQTGSHAMAMSGDVGSTWSEGNDTLIGGGGADTIFGGGGADTIDGGAGNDTIDGGAGNDSISGGADSDVIIMKDGFGANTVLGGETGTDDDTIDLGLVTTGVIVDLSGDEAGTITDGTDTITFTECECRMNSPQKCRSKNPQFAC
jgi:Ca2+-binding RTX toxin-like protein